MSEPDVSVVVPVYDGAATVGRCVASVLAQHDVDLELLVVDDGSADGSGDVVRAFGDRRVRLLRREHVGVCAARNAGVADARGRYVTFLDADDLAEPHWVRTLLDLAEQRGAAVACCGTRMVRPDRVRIRRPRIGPGRTHPTLFLPGSFLVERQLLLDVGGFDEQLRFSENTELGMRLEQACEQRGRPIAATEEPLISMDRSGSGRSKPWRLASVERILDVHEPYFRAHPAKHAQWLGLAAVEAARHGRYRRSVAYAARAVLRRPADPRAWARLAGALVPFAAGRRWRSAGAPAAHQA